LGTSSGPTTQEVSRPIYEALSKFEGGDLEKFPMVYSKFQEGILSMEGTIGREYLVMRRINPLKIPI